MFTSHYSQSFYKDNIEAFTLISCLWATDKQKDVSNVMQTKHCMLKTSTSAYCLISGFDYLGLIFSLNLYKAKLMSALKQVSVDVLYASLNS